MVQRIFRRIVIARFLEQPSEWPAPVRYVGTAALARRAPDTPVTFEARVTV
jgi:hypothetical protein